MRLFGLLGDSRKRMDAGAFDRLFEPPGDPEDMLLRLHRSLILENPAVPDCEDAPKRLRSLTRGQKALIRLALLDMEVRNGGLSQFVWNHPLLFPDIPDDLALVGCEEGLSHYDRALEQFLGGSETWLEIRTRRRANTEEELEAFLESREEIDFDWFDDAYYNTYDNNGPTQVVASVGIGDKILHALITYVRTNPGQFIR